MKKLQSIKHIRQTLSPVPRLCLLLALLVAGLLSSCTDDTFTSGSGAEPPADGSDATDMYISVSVPRTLAASGTAADKENRIETLDVLVFRNGVGSAVGSYFAYAACQGKPAENGKTFQVSMPVGEHFIIHVFANCHDELTAKGFYNSRGREMNTLLRELTTGGNANNGHPNTLPMHGYLSDVTIKETDVNRSLTVPVLRSVASVRVMTNLTQSGGTSAPTFTPGEVTGTDGRKNFDLRELYVYFYPDSACVGAATTSYEALAAGDTDETRNVRTVSLPCKHSVADTRWDDPDLPNNPKPYNLISPVAVGELGSVYFYENKPWSDNGYDRPDAYRPAATTRIVVGGVYGTDVTPDGTPRVTYYRIDFAAPNGSLNEILRNHQYIFNIKSVGGSGYDTPDDAALGVPVNIYIEVIDWVNEVEHVDFDMQNYFRSETKSVVLPRDAGSQQSIPVESDVEAWKWEMAFAADNNGTASLSTDGNTLSNARYKVEKAADGKSLTFTSLKAYDNVTLPETLDETLVLKVRNLNITYRITQADSSPDDWGNGGDQNWDEGEKVIDLGSAFTFYFAPGNLRAVKNADGTLTHSFAPEQQITSQNDPMQGGYCFTKNKLNPFYGEIDNGGDGDPCTKVGTGWYTPSSSQLQQVVSLGRCGGSIDNRGGYYYGRTTVPTPAEDPYGYLFLPTARSRLYDGTTTSLTYYRISDGTVAAGLSFSSNSIVTSYWQVNGKNVTGAQIRCIKNKK